MSSFRNKCYQIFKIEKSKRKIIFIALNLLIIGSSPIYASNIQNQTKKSNFEIIDSLVKIESYEVCQLITKNEVKELEILVLPHPASYLIEQYFLSCANDKGLTFFLPDSNSNRAKITLWISSIDVKYERISSDSDSLTRIISVSLSGKMQTKEGTIKAIEILERTYNDLITDDDIVYIQNSSYNFTKGQIPPQQSTFFDSIVEPLVVVTAAIITIVLLFTVRSN